MTSYLAAHLSDLGIGIALGVLAVILLTVALCRAASRDQSRLPGGLARDDTWPAVEAWEDHCRTTPGVGEVGESPVFDALCVEAWDRQMEETS